MKLEPRSPRKPSAEAERLQRQLHEKFVAQRRKDAFSLQTSAADTGWGGSSKKSRAEKVREKKVAKIQENKAARDQKKEAKLTKKKLKAQEIADKRTARKTALLEREKKGERLQEPTKISRVGDARAASQRQPKGTDESKAGGNDIKKNEATGSSENPTNAAPPAKDDDVRTPREDSSVLTSTDPAVAGQLKGKHRGLDDALKTDAPTKEEPSPSEPTTVSTLSPWKITED